MFLISSTTNAALMGINESNAWTSQYTSSWIMDTFFLQIIDPVLKISVFKFVSGK